MKVELFVFLNLTKSQNIREVVDHAERQSTMPPTMDYALTIMVFAYIYIYLIQDFVVARLRVVNSHLYYDMRNHILSTYRKTGLVHSSKKLTRLYRWPSIRLNESICIIIILVCPLYDFHNTARRVIISHWYWIQIL